MRGPRLSSLNVWHGVTLALDEQMVRLYWRVIGFETVICVRYSVRSHSHPDVVFKYTTMSMTPLHLFSFNENGTVSCSPWTNSAYVCIGVCLNLKMLFVFDAV